MLVFLDAFTVNKGLLGQIEGNGVDEIRYIADEGEYSMELPSFLSKATILRKFACGEDVYALPRSEWRFCPKSREKPLILFKLEDE